MRLARHAATVLLLVALVLPLSRCSGQHSGNSAGQASEPSAYTYHYAWSDFDPLSLGSWLIMLVFAWPLALLLYERIARRPSTSAWLRGAQVLLSAGSIYLIYLRTFLDELWYGGYLAYTALSACLLASLVECVLSVRMKMKEGRARPEGQYRRQDG